MQTALGLHSSLSSVTDRVVVRFLVQKYRLTWMTQHLTSYLRCPSMWRHIVERVTPTFRTITTQQICNFSTYKKGTHRTTHTKSKRVHGSKLQLGFQHTIPRSTPNAVRHSTLRPLWCAATHIDSTKLKAYTQNAPFFRVSEHESRLVLFWHTQTF